MKARKGKLSQCWPAGKRSSGKRQIGKKKTGEKRTEL